MSWNVAPSHEEIAFLMESSLVYRDSGRFNEAREILNGVRALAPQNETVLVCQGALCLQQKDFEGAERYYRQALDLNPRSAYAYAHLGELEIFRQHKQQSAEYLKTAARLDPRGPNGALARALMEFNEAVRYSEGV